MLQRNVPGWALFALGTVLGAFIGAGIAAQLFSGDELVVRVEPAVTPTRVVVYVQGAVRRAGLYEVASDARVGSVVELAGPLETADFARVPMAERVRDGQTITVPYQSPVAGSSEEGGVSPREPGNPADRSGPIDVNRASVEELQRLPGVGPALAQRIVTYREEHGPFRSVDELANVAGISERMVAEWGDLVTIGGTE
ncbi:ComEA family DNA-binding protein [Thermomicrobium sp. 4228-Ro]|uniref:ComEA family DNA-binding protein n=1 Tax=Thermomicrobium sp. 4228-Ro TaxID=2993937 RepID=UPI00224931B8|nr:ComEA family DNA-binding protein [Thermomicrobium sp. 4228-Ro]MCX2726214.1 ComEA family DNA-binding protein [Thermomicrobium sp. 4228-Ro]